MTSDKFLRMYLNHDSPHIRNRAAIILATIDGQSIEEIAQDVGLSARTITKWQDAWEENGMQIFPPLPEPEQATEKQQPDIAPQAKLVVESSAMQAEEPAESVSSEPEQLQTNDPMAEAGRKIMLARLSDMRENESTARLGEDIEGVHKMRVATRRWRSAFDVFEQYLPGSYRKEFYRDLRRTARALGAVRDLDVFLNNAHKYITVELNNDPGDLQHLIAIIEKKRRRARKDLLRWLDHKKYAAFTSRAMDRLQKPTKHKTVRLSGNQPTSLRLDHLLPGMVYDRLEAVRRYEDVLEDAPIEVLHELRIDCKRLRYTLEAFEAVLGESAQVAIQATKALQDHLGDLNDAEVADGIIADVKSKLPDKQAKAAAKAYQKALRKRQKDLVNTFPQAWEKFNQKEVREALALAVAL